MRLSATKAAQYNELANPTTVILMDEATPDPEDPAEFLEREVTAEEIDEFVANADWNQSTDWKGIVFTEHEMPYLKRALEYFRPFMKPAPVHPPIWKEIEK